MSVSAWVVIVGSLGVGQALLLATTLLLADKRRCGAIFIAAALFALAGLEMGDVLHHIGATHQRDWLEGCFDPGFFLIGPCIWLHVRSVTGAMHLGRLKVLGHFVPAIGVLTAYLFAQMSSTGTAVVSTDLNVGTRLIDSVGSTILLLAIACHIGGYLLVSSRDSMYFARVRLRNVASTPGAGSGLRSDVGWLRTLLIATLTMLAVWIVSWTQPRGIGDLVTAISTASFILVVGAGALSQLTNLGRAQTWPQSDSRSIHSQGDTATIVTLHARPVFDSGSAEIDTPMDVLVREEEATLTQQEAAVRARIVTLMDVDKMFLEPELSLPGICAAAKATPHVVSRVLNDCMGISFHDYVNGLRLAEVRRCLLDPMYDSQTVLQIAFASGFSSKATFNAVFKRVVGVTPTEFRRQRRLPG